VPPFVIMVKQYLDFCRDTLRTIHNPEPWYGLTGKFVKNHHRGTILSSVLISRRLRRKPHDLNVLVRTLEPGFTRGVERLCYLNNCVESLNGVSDGFRNSSNTQAIHVDQSLTNADRGNIEQEIRNSATSCNQESDEDVDWCALRDLD